MSRSWNRTAAATVIAVFSSLIGLVVSVPCTTWSDESATPLAPELGRLQGALPSFVLSALYGTNFSGQPNRISPGMAIAVGGLTASGNAANSLGGTYSYRLYAGSFTYDVANAAAVTEETRYDLASLTKVVATTTAAAVLYQKGLLDLDMLVVNPTLLGPKFAAPDPRKNLITVKMLLLHTAGYPPDPTPFWYFEPGFGCPETNNSFYPRQEFSCVERVYHNLVWLQTLASDPGAEYVYSDLSMITMMFIIGKIASENGLVNASDLSAVCPDSGNYLCYYLSFVNETVVMAGVATAVPAQQQRRFTETPLPAGYPSPFPPQINNSGCGCRAWDDPPRWTAGGFLPTDPSVCPPQWIDADYRRRFISGFVSDENAYALGGVSGHAGYFATLAHVEAIARIWLLAPDSASEAPSSSVPLNRSTVQTFATLGGGNASSRALGWDTSTGGCGTGFSLNGSTLTHTGFTGGRICIDLVNKVYVVLLANAKYQEKRNPRMIGFQPRVMTAISRMVKDQPVFQTGIDNAEYLRFQQVPAGCNATASTNPTPSPMTGSPPTPSPAVLASAANEGYSTTSFVGAIVISIVIGAIITYVLQNVIGKRLVGNRRVQSAVYHNPEAGNLTDQSMTAVSATV
jgi:CubicO group peptidase (beta-lactamase class C family)